MPPATQSQRRDRRSGVRQDEQPAPNRRRRRHQEGNSDQEAYGDGDGDGSDDDQRNGGSDAMELDEENEQDALHQLTKNMIRYAISCEHSRTSIRRDAIKDKVLGPNNARKFRQVFDDAQQELRSVFGMEMVELPVKDQVHLTAAERKKKAASANSQHQQKSTKVWVLKTTLPAEFRVPAIIPPSKAPTQEHEAAYVGLYTWLIALITIAGGQISQSKLERALTRVNANVNTPVGKTADFLAKARLQGYIDRIVDKSQGDDDQVTFIVGARGRTEISKEALANHIRGIYGPDPGPDFEERLAATLGLPKGEAKDAEVEMGDGED